MRRPKRWGFWLLGLLIAASCGQHLGARWLVRVDRDLTTLSRTERHIVYSLPSEEWLSFRLLPFHQRLRLLTTAEILPEEEIEGEGRYSLEWQLTDASGQPLSEAPLRYHFNSRPADGFYLDRVAQPLESRTLELPLEHLESRPTLLRVRLHQAAKPVHGVALRVLAFEPVADFKVASRWHRLSPEGRRQLARWSVFGPELLDRRERRDLMRSRWVPLPPNGSRRDFEQRVLHLRPDASLSEPTSPAAEPGWSLISGLRGLVPVPRAGLLRLVVHTGEEAEANSEVPVQELTWRWHPAEEAPSARLDRGTEPQKQILTESDGPTVFSILVEEPGQLEIEAPRPISVRVFLDRGRRETEITPQPAKVRLYPLSAGRALEWRLLPTRHLFRLDLRALGEIPADRHARYELLDDQGEPLASGQLAVSSQLSASDLLEIGGQPHRVSERSSHFLRLLSEVRRVRLTSAHPIWVAAYNHPEDLLDVTRVSADDHQRDTWFWLRPSPGSESGTKDRSLLQIGERLREVDPRMAEGEYQWQAFHPQGDWSGHYLLVPRPELGTGRSRAGASTYRKVAAGQPYRLRFRKADGDLPARPRLIFRRAANQSFQVAVRLEGQTVLEQTLAGQWGELRLPPVVTSKSVGLEIEASSPAIWWVSHTVDAEAQAWVKRLAIGVDSRPLVIPYTKRGAGEELLSGRLFLPAGQTVSAVLDLRLRGAGAARPQDLKPRPTWTLRERRYIFEPRQNERDSTAEVRALTEGGGPLTDGQPFFFRFGTDLPAGHYEIVLSPDSAAGSFLTLSRRLPGVAEKRDLWVRRVTEVTADAS